MNLNLVSVSYVNLDSQAQSLEKKVRFSDFRALVTLKMNEN